MGLVISSMVTSTSRSSSAPSASFARSRSRMRYLAPAPPAHRARGSRSCQVGAAPPALIRSRKL